MAEAGESARRPVIPFSFDEVAVGRGLGGNALMVYMYLSLRAGRGMISWPSIRTMARDTGLSNNTIQDILDTLLENKLISRISDEKRGEYWTVNDPPRVEITDARKGSESVWASPEQQSFLRPVKAREVKRLEATTEQWQQADQLVQEMLAIRATSLKKSDQVYGTEQNTARELIQRYGYDDVRGAMLWVHANQNGRPWRMSYVTKAIGQWIIDGRPQPPLLQPNGRLSRAEERSAKMDAARAQARAEIMGNQQPAFWDDENVIDVPVRPTHGL